MTDKPEITARRARDAIAKLVIGSWWLSRAKDAGISQTETEDVGRQLGKVLEAPETLDEREIDDDHIPWIGNPLTW